MTCPYRLMQTDSPLSTRSRIAERPCFSSLAVAVFMWPKLCHNSLKVNPALAAHGRVGAGAVLFSRSQFVVKLDPTVDKLSLAIFPERRFIQHLA